MIQFIDSNCMVGRRMMPREGAPKSTEDLKNLMDELGITQAVVYHSIAKESDMKLGNSLLSEEVKGSGRFFKQWAVMPNVWNEFLDPSDLCREMKAQNITSVRLFPQAFGYSLKPYACGALLERLASHKVPIFIDRDQLSSWDALYELCNDYPNARFVLCNTTYHCTRFLVPIVSACDNLYVETSTFLMHNGVQHFCEQFGAHRMIFGSNAPEASMAAGVSLIRYANLSPAEKEMIASKNIQQLLGEVTL